MADNSTKKTYLKGSAKQVTFSNGSSIINLDLNVEQINSLPKTDSGYLKLTISELKTPDQYGNTHKVYLNDFKPTSQGSAPKAESKGLKGFQKPKSTDDYPF